MESDDDDDGNDKFVGATAGENKLSAIKSAKALQFALQMPLTLAKKEEQKMALQGMDILKTLPEASFPSAQASMIRQSTTPKDQRKFSMESNWHELPYSREVSAMTGREKRAVSSRARVDELQMILQDLEMSAVQMLPQEFN